MIIHPYAKKILEVAEVVIKTLKEVAEESKKYKPRKEGVKK